MTSPWPNSGYSLTMQERQDWLSASPGRRLQLHVSGHHTRMTRPLVAAILFQSAMLGVIIRASGADIAPAPEPPSIAVAMAEPEPPPEPTLPEPIPAPEPEPPAPQPLVVAQQQPVVEQPPAPEPPPSPEPPAPEPPPPEPVRLTPPPPDETAPPAASPPALPRQRPPAVKAVHRVVTEPPRLAATPPQPTTTVAAAVPLALPKPSAPSTEAKATLQSRIRAAIQAALRYPPAAAAMQLTGRAQVQLEYQAGSVRNVQLERSAGSPILDRAALAAVHDAHYPDPPAEIGDTPLVLLVWVILDTDTKS